jgi:hypothetical protein
MCVVFSCACEKNVNIEIKVTQEIIAYFFFPQVFAITCGFSREFAENRKIWGLNCEIVRKHKKL